MDALGSRVVPLTDEGGDLWQRHFASADMVIEAVPEDLALKHRLDKKKRTEHVRQETGDRRQQTQQYSAVLGYVVVASSSRPKESNEDNPSKQSIKIVLFLGASSCPLVCLSVRFFVFVPSTK
ncbi:unnamed protein product [Discosporangium mesarthrocarpum]